MVETDLFLRALAKGFTAAQLNKLIQPTGADITPRFRRQKAAPTGGGRKKKKKASSYRPVPPAPPPARPQEEERRAPLQAVETNSTEARLAKLESEVFQKQRAKDESLRRRHALGDPRWQG